jgi:hypothetical protein
VLATTLEATWVHTRRQLPLMPRTGISVRAVGWLTGWSAVKRLGV